MDQRAREKAAQAAQAIEPIIGHRNADHRMDRCPLKGETGDRLHAVLWGAGYNIKWLLRMPTRKGITLLAMIILCLQQACSQGRSWLGSVMAKTLRTAKSSMSVRYLPGIHLWLSVDLPVAA